MNRSKAIARLVRDLTGTRLRAGLIRFVQAREAIAAVEFALILPALMTLYLGTVEVSTAVSVDKRVATVAGTLGDLVARADGTLSQATLNDYFDASSATMSPYSSSSLKQIVTCVYVDADGNTQIMWSRAYNGGTAHTAGQAYALPTQLTDIARDKYVIVSEAGESYTPILGYVFQSNFNFYHEFYHLPRFGEYIAVS